MISANHLENKAMKLVNKSTVTLKGVKPGNTVDVETDAHGVPLDPFWRRRLRDAAIDGCVEKVKSSRGKATAEAKDNA